MRLKFLFPAALLLVPSAPASAQEWIEYASRRDFFSVNFPGEPAIRDVTYETEYGLTLDGRVYSVEDATGRYSVTVIDYSDAEKMHTARAAACKAAGGDGDSCNNPGRGDVRGAMVHASWSFITRGSEVTHFALYNADLVEGIRLQLLNKDGSRTCSATARRAACSGSSRRCTATRRAATASNENGTDQALGFGLWASGRRPRRTSGAKA
ncbi:MAG: hypothetical protein HYY76_07030 [Acidobacteria bacterium]|nr:hypothetical protein [Acidobacteriota bacterium]